MVRKFAGSDPGSKMATKMDAATAALEEFIQLLLEYRGELELERAVLRLSPRNRKFVSDYGALEFVKRFPQLFSHRQRKSKVMVKLDVPLKFCPKAEENAGCADRTCGLLHLCHYFVKEGCKFGVKCKRSHNYGDEHTIRVLRHFRLDFLNFNLLQKILKIIADENEIQRAATNRSVPDICKFYNKGTDACKNGDLCPWLHVCEHFVDGDCKFVGKCMRDHDFSHKHNKQVLKEYKMDRISDLQVLQRLKGRERKRTSSASSEEDNTILPSIHRMAQSPRSSNFPMPPPLTQQQAVPSHSIPEICKFYSKATCKKGDQCSRLHVCEHFISGDCRFGEKCKKEHDFSSSHNKRILHQHGMGGISELKVLQRLQAREMKQTVSTSSGSERPQQFMPMSANPVGVPSNQANKSMEKDTEICGFNLRGKCNYGNSCIHHHTELPYLWQFAAEGDDKWESFSSELNTMLEHAYCNVEDDIPLMITDFFYNVRFQDMTAVPQAVSF
ncbi:hypothetical protein ACROYT_G022684 [Oculina patagonica]